MYVTSEGDGRLCLHVEGRLDSAAVGDADRQLSTLSFVGAATVTVDLRNLTVLDTAGAWLIQKAGDRARADHAQVLVEGARAEHAALLHHVATSYRTCDIEPTERPVVIRILSDVGENTFLVLRLLGALQAFLYRLTVTLLAAIGRPGLIRGRAVAHQLEAIGTRSIPIIGLIAFLIGGVLVNQSAYQLQRFGAEIFVVDLIAIAVFRELGVLLTAIMVAGRSGSAFTAHIGSMKLNEEIDAMTTMGMNPMSVLVLPRLLAFMIALPILTLLANFAALAGGVLMAWVTLDISPAVFVARAAAALQGWTPWLGVVKAPIFATVVTVCGCFEGLMVDNGATGLGRHTTRSVVESIFLVIVLDAMFAVLFAAMNI